jgi:predicted metal-dependent phosphoesterase TrpH
MIDLHLHTTASDGACTPFELVERAARSGIRTLSVTDHDTMAATTDVARCAADAGVEAVGGIEITSVWGQRDVHVLGYFLRPEAPGLVALLARQADERFGRAREIVERLASAGAVIDPTMLFEQREKGTTIARPHIAAALVAQGFAESIKDAFDRFLGPECPAYVPHRGPSPEQVVTLIRSCGGVSSLAHPGLVMQVERLIPSLVDAGLAAIEAFHSEHSSATTARFAEVARVYGLALTGGSDYHGEGRKRADALGRVGLPEAEFARLCERAGALI